MNRAALYSAEVLARFDQSAQEHYQQALQAEQEQGQFELHSGRAISKLPYGLKAEEGDMSTAMVKFASSPPRKETDIEDDASESGELTAAQMAVAQRMMAMQRMPFPTSTMGQPGEAGASQIATLQAKLMQRLGPEYISNRQGPSGGQCTASFIEMLY